MRRAYGIAAIAAAIAISSTIGGADAQPYPSRPIKIVVPATPGGAIDIIARHLADKMTVSMGQSVVVENKPGASNNLGTDFVAKSTPPRNSSSSNCLTTRWRTSSPVAFTHIVPLLLAVHPAVPATNVKELIA